MTDSIGNVRDIAAVGEIRRGELSAALSHVRTLGDVIEWARTQGPPVRIDEIVTQDEYTHDVLVPVAVSEWLAFDVT